MNKEEKVVDLLLSAVSMLELANKLQANPFVDGDRVHDCFVACEHQISKANELLDNKEK